jgi:hypothetical protein
MTNLEDLKKVYIDFLKERTTLKQIDHFIEITTPFLDRHNDYIQIYAESLSDKAFRLSDAGETISDLLLYGVDIKTPKRQKVLTEILNGFGVSFDEETKDLFSTCSLENYALKKHNLLQAILSVDDMFYLAKPHIKSFFYEDVTKWLDQSDVRYSENIKLEGKTGFDYKFDFLIPKSKEAPERLIKAINHPDRKSAESFIMAWDDTREKRHSDTKAFAFLNDLEPIKDDIIYALKTREIEPIMWTERTDYLEQLVA